MITYTLFIFCKILPEMIFKKKEKSFEKNMNNLWFLVKLQMYFPQLGPLRDAGMIIFLTDIEGPWTTSVLPAKTFGSNDTSNPDLVNVSKFYLYGLYLNCDGVWISGAERHESQMACCLMCSTVSELSKHNYGTTMFAWIIWKSRCKKRNSVKVKLRQQLHHFLCVRAALRWQD